MQVTEQIKEKEARKDILNRPLPVSRDLPLAAESKVWRPEEVGWLPGLCAWLPAEAVCLNMKGCRSRRIRLVLLHCPSSVPHPPTPTHTHIKGKEREANLRCNREIFGHVKPKEQPQSSLKNWNCAWAETPPGLVISQYAASRTRMAQSERASEDIRSEGTFLSSWLFKTKTRETIEQRQTPR